MSDEEKKRVASHEFFDALGKATDAAQTAGLTGSEIWAIIENFYCDDFRAETEIVVIPY